MFSVKDVAVLTYPSMARLAAFATFSEALQAVMDVAQPGLAVTQTRSKIEAISEAYMLVGIT